MSLKPALRGPNSCPVPVLCASFHPGGVAAFNPDTYGMTNGMGAGAPQPAHGSDIDALNRRISDLERHAYGQAGEALPEPRSGETGAGYQDGAGITGAQVAEEGTSAGHAQDAGNLAAGVRAYLLDVTRDLTRNAHRALAQCKWNPGDLVSADIAFAAAEQAAREARALLTALASCPSPEGPTPEQARSVVESRQRQTLDHINLLIWQLQGYANLIAGSPFNGPALLALEQALNEASVETHNATFALGTALRDARLAG